MGLFRHNCHNLGLMKQKLRTNEINKELLKLLEK